MKVSNRKDILRYRDSMYLSLEKKKGSPATYVLNVV